MGRHPSRRHATPDDAPIGRRIRARRRELGLTQAALAAPAYTKSFISQIESGVADPSLDSLRFLSRALQSSLSLLAGDTVDQRLAAVEGLLQWGQDVARTRETAFVRRVLETAVEMAAVVGLNGVDTGARLLLAEFEAAYGDPNRAEHVLAQIAEPAGSPGPRVAARRALAAGAVALRRGDHAAAGAAFSEALRRLGTGLRHPDLVVRATLGLAAGLRLAGDLKAARRRADAAARLAARLQDPVLRGEAGVVAGQVALAHGAPDEARRMLRSACAALDATDDVRAQTTAWIHLGRAAVAGGDAAEALQAAREARTRAAGLGDETISRQVDALARAAAELAARARYDAS
jgi:ATP/maltotriose-dependent transcriptional regulator MalT/DNA-binding XRE family transcriptional regulator